MLRVVFVALTLVGLAGAKEDPVQWALAPVAGYGQVVPGSKVYLELKAAIEPGWHLYSPTTPAGGPIVTKLGLAPNPALAAYNVYRPEPVRKLDPNFGIDTETYTGTVSFLLEATSNPSAAGSSSLEATARYQACSDKKCLNPVKKTVATPVVFVPGAAHADFKIPAGYALVPAVASTAAPSGPLSVQQQPVSSKPIAARDEDSWTFVLTAFVFGLAALFTPCVFPMIPITVSFFLNQSDEKQSKRGGLAQAIVFCLGIIVLFTGLGLVVTAVAGPFGVVQLGSSPWVNGFIALVFLVF